jgi:hypothetical protein
MSNSDLNDTLPTYAPVPQDEPNTTGQPGRRRVSWKLFTLLGIVVLLMIAIASGLGGYLSGINLRKEAEVTVVSQKAVEQFELALEDIASEQYGRARQRLEYVADLDPGYPGLTEKLALVLVLINATPTPVPVPTPTLSVTLDPSQAGEQVENLFQQAQQALLNSDWDGAINILLDLRKAEINYRPVEVDGVLFLALRNRGIDKIIKQADLEGGLYDLSLAEKFGPLDTEAQSYITWTSLYITGASFWELDWVKVIEYFSDVATQFPGLRDRSGWTAKERYRLALKFYGIQLLNGGDPCGAAAQLELSLSLGTDSEAEQAYADARQGCDGGAVDGQPGGEQPPVAPTQPITPLPTDPFQPPVSTPYPPPPVP